MTRSRKPKRHHSAAVFDAARRDYQSGLSAEVVAERHDLSTRTLHRHASRDGWRKCDPMRPPALSDPDAPGLASLSRQTFDAVAGHDHLLDVIADSESERLDLIVKPDIQNMRQFAFRRAAEAAALGGVAEANAWVRLIVSMDKASPDIRRDLSPFGHADLLRAEHAKATARLTAMIRPQKPRDTDQKPEASPAAKPSGEA